MASIERRTTANGGESFRVRLRHGGRRHNLAFDTEAAARRWKALAEVNPEQALAALATPSGSDLPPTVHELVEAHIDQLTGVEPGTRSNYRGYLARHIDPHAISRRLAAGVTRADLAAWVTWLHEDRGLSGKTIRNIHGLMSAAMTTATRDGIRPDNPCRGMRLPRTTHADREHTYLTREEFAELYRLIPAFYQPLVMLLVGTGLRFGEATALRVRDVDLAAREARIVQAWKATNGNGRRLGPTKTLRSTRTVALPANVCDLIRPFMAGRDPDTFVITNRRGGPVRQAAFWRGTWRPAVAEFAGDEYEVDRRTFKLVKTGPGKHPRVHDLRHTFASWHIQAGTPLPVIQRQLGHESIQTTVDTYGHLARADFDALGAATAAWLPPTVPEIEPPADAAGD